MRTFDFAATIKTTRIRNDFSIEQLSCLTGIPAKELIKAEEGEKVRFSSFQITVLADALFCNRQYLLDLYGWKKGDDSISDYLEFIGNRNIWTDLGDTELSFACLKDSPRAG